MENLNLYPDLDLRLKFARIAANLTQQELAAKVGVSQSLIAKIEAGRSKNPRSDILVRLTGALLLPEGFFLNKSKLKELKDDELLKQMLVNLGINEEAARIIVHSLSKNTKKKLKIVMKKEKPKKRKEPTKQPNGKQPKVPA